MDCVNILVPLTASEVQIQIGWSPHTTQLPCDTYSTILLILQCFKCLVYIRTGKCERRFWWVQGPGTNKGTFQPTQATTATSRGTSGWWGNAPVCTTRRWQWIPVGITCKCFPRAIPYSGNIVDNGRCNLFDWCPHLRKIWHLPHLKKMNIPSQTLIWRMLDPEDNSTMILHMLVMMRPIKQHHIPDDLWPSATLMWQLQISHGSSAFFIYAKMMNSSPHKWLPFISTRTFSNSNPIFPSYALWYICHRCTVHLITKALQWKKDKGYLICSKYSYIMNSNGLPVIHLSQTHLIEHQGWLNM